MRLDHLLSMETVRDERSSLSEETERQRCRRIEIEEKSRIAHNTEKKDESSIESSLFNFQSPMKKGSSLRGCSSVGRAPALQAGGQEFESLHLHQVKRSGGRKTEAGT